ncbi:MAG: pantoate--beta-alanine ligase [Chloroflexi bacterium]|nr:pantoate--beta-alanine ligase [Chloroflexota bacterium]
MHVVSSVADVRRIRRELAGSWGLVPTMGFLHAGHLALVERAAAENDHVGVSIFVNPTQFGPAEDLTAYPRDIGRDLELLREAGADLVWTPPVDEVYPPGYQTYVAVEEVTKPLEGAARPTHFRGVATVVAKLFNVFQPDRAYFGQKDAQQVVVIRQMARDLDFPIEIVVCPIVREPDGLAMSSRNIYLTPEQRAAAPALYRALCAARDAWRSGEHDAGRLRQIMAGILAAETLAEVEYVSAADPITLVELEDAAAGALLSLAVRIGRARLIDNVLVGW